MIEIVNFSKSYNLTTKNSEFSVKNVSFTVQEGQITGLLGLNGSGKTTIIKAICAFHFPSCGEIFVTGNGKKVNILENPEKAMELIGYVPEISQLSPDMKVIDFLIYSAKVHNIEKENLKNSVKNVIKLCQLEKVLNKKIKTLSKGYQQRVSFAQGIIHNPPNIILDEPINGLDPSQIIQMRKLIKELSKTKAILISTHILSEVTSLCKNVVIISNGKICAKGTEEEIIKNSNTKDFETAFMKVTGANE